MLTQLTTVLADPPVDREIRAFRDGGVALLFNAPCIKLDRPRGDFFTELHGNHADSMQPCVDEAEPLPSSSCILPFVFCCTR
jgi:hypothetical protein